MIRSVMLGSLAALYGSVVKARAAAYRSGRLKSAELPVPVVSVGNLTVGGSGKTPLTLALARKLLELQAKPAIISRGYRGSSRAPAGVVTDGEHILMGYEAAGDEPYMMATQLAGTPIVVGRKRATAGAAAISRFGSTILILDDGFQHLQLRRDLDVVLLDGSQPLKNDRLLPLGRMREPLTALNRADLIVVNHGRDREELEQEIRAAGFGGDILYGEHQPEAVQLLREDESFEPSWLKGKKIAAFCGLGQPLQFRATLENLGATVISFEAYRDHYRYSANHLAALDRIAERCGAEALVTTAKDAVKLTSLPQTVPLAVLTIRFSFNRGEDILDRNLLELVEVGPRIREWRQG